MPRSRSLQDLIDSGSRSSGRVSRSTPSGASPVQLDTRTGGGAGQSFLSGEIKNAGTSGIKSGFASKEAGGSFTEGFIDGVSNSVSGTVNSTKNLVGAGTQTTGAATAAEAGGVAAGTTLGAGASSGAAAGAASGAAGAAGGSAAAGGAAGAAGSGSGGGLLALFGICHATAEYYPVLSPQWWDIRNFFLHQWTSPLGLLWKHWYSRNSQWLATQIRTYPLLKRALKPFFEWALYRARNREI